MNCDDVTLSHDLVSYLQDRPKTSTAQYPDRSECELRIVSELMRAECSDDEIISFFLRHSPPIFTKKGIGWLRSIIFRSHESIDEFRHTHPHTHVIENGHTLDEKSDTRTYAPPHLPFLVLRERLQREDEGEIPILSQWQREIIDVSIMTAPLSHRTARRLADDLVRCGYVRTEPRPSNRKAVLLTERGRAAAQPVYGWMARWIPLRSGPSPETTAAEHTQALPLPASTVESQTPVEPAAMEIAPDRPKRTKRRTPEEHARRYAEKTRKHGQLNGFLRLQFKGNRKPYIQILTPPNEWLGVESWLQLHLGFDANGLPVYRSIADDEPIARHLERLKYAYPPYPQNFLVAAQLVRKRDGFQVHEQPDEHGVLKPSVGVIAQAMNFFGPLIRVSDPCGHILRVSGTGRTGSHEYENRRRYRFEVVAPAIELDPSPNIQEVKESLVDGTAESLAEALPAGWFKMPPMRKQLLFELGVLRLSQT